MVIKNGGSGFCISAASNGVCGLDIWGLGSRSRRRGQRRRRWWSAGAKGVGRRTRSPRWRGRSRNDGSSPSANRGGGRDGERLTSSRAWRSTADTMCCGSPRRRRRRGGAAALGRDGEAGRARCRRDRHARRDPTRAGWWSATITWREEGSGGRLVWMRSSTTATRTPSLSSP